MTKDIENCRGRTLNGGGASVGPTFGGVLVAGLLVGGILVVSLLIGGALVAGGQVSIFSTVQWD